MHLNVNLKYLAVKFGSYNMLISELMVFAFCICNLLEKKGPWYPYYLVLKKWLISPVRRNKNKV